MSRPPSRQRGWVCGRRWSRTAPVPGGNASREIRVGPGGAGGHVLPFREPGICEEIAEGFHRAGGDWSAAIDLVVAATPNLEVHLDTEAVRPVMAGRRIIAIEAEDIVAGARYRLEAPLFADRTGDGVIAAAAGCTFRHGEEARSERDEARAPEQPTRHTMGTSILHHSTRMAEPQPFTPPPFAVRFTAEHFTKRRQNLIHGTWWIEYGGLRDTIVEAEEIRDELLRVISGAFDWAKNHDPEHRAANTHYKLAAVFIVGGKRESRRFLGDYILTQNDVEGGRIFRDAVAYGGWPIDIHPPQCIRGKDIPPAIFTHLKAPYTIPIDARMRATSTTSSSRAATSASPTWRWAAPARCKRSECWGRPSGRPHACAATAAAARAGCTPMRSAICNGCCTDGTGGCPAFPTTTPPTFAAGRA